MNIEIASLIGSILAVTVSVTFAITFKISLNNFKTEVNQRLTNIETKINMINEKKNRKCGSF